MENSTRSFALPSLEKQAERYVEIGLIDRLADFTAAHLLEETRKLQLLQPTQNALLALSPILCPPSLMATFMVVPGEETPAGVIAEDMKDVDLFTAGPGITIPRQVAYVVEDPLMHHDRISSTPKVAGRTVLTVSEGIAWQIQTQGALIDKYGFIALGSRIFTENAEVDPRVPTLSLVTRNDLGGAQVPELGWGKWTDHQKHFGFGTTAKRSAE